jgi:hypothetical protein
MQFVPLPPTLKVVYDQKPLFWFQSDIETQIGTYF